MPSFMQSTEQQEAPDLGNYRLNYLRDQVMELYRWSMEEHERRLCDDWYHYYRHFKNYVDKRLDKDSYKSNIGVGLAFPIVEIVHARMMEPWMSGDAMIKAIALQSAGEARAPKVGAYINHTLQNKVARSYALHSMFTKSACLFGRGVMKPHVSYTPPVTLLKRVAMSINSMMGPIRVGSFPTWEEEKAKQEFTIGYVDPFDWWTVPGARASTDKWEWCIERGYQTHVQALLKQQSGEWDESVEILDSDGLGYDEFRMRRQSLETNYSDHVPRSSTRQRKPHRTIEFQGMLEVKDDPAEKARIENLRIVIVDEKQIVVEQKLKSWNGRPEYLVLEPCQDPCSERPIGLIEPIEDQLNEINSFENIGLDSARLAVERAIMIDPTSTKQDTLYTGPGEQNWVRNPKASVTTLDMGDLPQSFYQQMGFLQELVRQISGVNDYMGMVDGGGADQRTATGMQLMANVSASRFGPLVGAFDRDYYREISAWIHETAKLWMTRDEEIRQPGNPSAPFTTVGPDDMDASLQFEYNTRALDPTSDKRRQQFVDMVGLLTQQSEMMAAQGKMIDYVEVARILMDAFDRGGDVERLIKDIPAPALPTMPGATPGDALSGVLGPPPGTPMPEAA